MIVQTRTGTSVWFAMKYINLFTLSIILFPVWFITPNFWFIHEKKKTGESLLPRGCVTNIGHPSSICKTRLSIFLKEFYSLFWNNKVCVISTFNISVGPSSALHFKEKLRKQDGARNAASLVSRSLAEATPPRRFSVSPGCGRPATWSSTLT